MVTLSLVHACHRRLVMFERHLSYPVPEGWTVVLFDVNGDYYAPSETFDNQADADAWAAAGLKDGVFIS